MFRLALVLTVWLVVADAAAAHTVTQHEVPAVKKRGSALARAAAYNPAAPVGSRYPGERPARDPWLDALRDTGTAFWRARGVSLPDAVPLDVASDLRSGDGDRLGVNGRGFNPVNNGDTRVVLNDAFVGGLLKRARSRKVSVAGRRAALNSLGQAVAHELGHVGGLHHSESGLMSTESLTGDSIPWEVRVLSRRLIPRERPRGR